MASESTPRSPSVPASLLPIATVGQTWRSTRTVLSDGVRVVPFSEIETINRRIDAVQQEVARQRLEADVFTRESGARAGIFVDPLLNDDMRDQGLSQTAAVVGGVLTLPIEATATALPNDVAAPTANPWMPSPLLAQPLRTGSMKVNPYMAFDPLPGSASLNPALDRWTESQTQWASAVTERFNTGHYVPGVSWVVGEDTATRTAQLGSTTNALEYLRQADVAYHIEGFGAGEQLASATFDGITLAVSGTADGNGTLDGSFHIPAKVPSGAKAVTFTGKGGSRASAVFVGQGQLTVNTLRQVNTITTIWVDPLAQTFVLDKATQLAGVDLWFTAKGGDARLQIRRRGQRRTSRTVLTEAHIPASSIVVSGGGHTRVLLPSPLSLAAGTEYAFVVLCDDAETALSVAELGKFDATAQQWVVSQPYQVGVLLSSSNASTWTAHQDRDLTFRLLEASFSGASSQQELARYPSPGPPTAASFPSETPNADTRCRVRHGPSRRGNPDRGRRAAPAPRHARDRADQRQGPPCGDAEGQPRAVARHAAHQRSRGPDRRLRYALHPRPRRDQGRARLRRRHPLRGDRHPADPQGLRRVGGAHGGRHHQSGRRACGVPLQGGALQRQRGQGQADPDRHGHGPPPRQQHPAHGRDLGAAMIDEKTTYLKLPLPHPDNLLEDDVLRLRETLQGLDANAKTQDDALKTQSDDLQGVEEELQQQKQDLRDLLAAAVVSAFSPAGSRTSAIAKGTNYTVPAYTVGNKRLRVYLCGLRCEAGTDEALHQYQEVGTAGAASTVIRWHDAIPTDYDILVEVI